MVVPAPYQRFWERTWSNWLTLPKNSLSCCTFRRFRHIPHGPILQYLMLNMHHIMRYSLCQKKINYLLACPGPGVNNPLFAVWNPRHTLVLHLCPVTRILVFDGSVSCGKHLLIIRILDDLFTTASSWLSRLGQLVLPKVLNAKDFWELQTLFIYSQHQ